MRTLMSRSARLLEEEGLITLFKYGAGFTYNKVGDFVEDVEWVFANYSGNIEVNLNSTSAKFVARNKKSIEATRWRISSERDQINDLVSELRDDDIFFDVGANTGVYTCFAAQHCDHVVSFEPYTPNVSELKENAEINGGNITIISKALSDETKETQISTPSEKEPGHGHGTFTGDRDDATTIQAVKGDDLVDTGELRPPSVIKIDVEGSEPLVLDGLNDSLKNEKCRIIYCEFHLPAHHRPSIEDFGSSVSEVWNEIEELGFTPEIVWGRGSPDFHLKAIKTSDRMPKAGYTFFGSPRAVYNSGKTFFGSISTKGDVQVTSLDHNNKEKPETTVLEEDFNSSVFKTDDHAAPQILVRNDGHIIAFWDRKVGEIRYKISDEPNDISSFGDQRIISTGGADYASPVQLPDGTILLFYRGPEASQHSYLESTDGGVNWTDRGSFITTSGERAVYTQNCVDDTDIHFVVSNHPRNDGSSRAFDGPHSIWYVRYDTRNETWHKADGTKITPSSDLPMDLVEDLDTVYDYTDTDNEAWLWDIVIDENRPRILYATFPSADDHRYHHSSWMDGEWKNSEIVSAGGSLIKNGSRTEEEYSGGLVFDHNDPDTVYVSLETNTNGFRINRMTSPDCGNTWMIDEKITSGFRPEYVHGNKGDITFVYMDGQYDFFEDFNTDIKWR